MTQEEFHKRYHYNPNIDCLGEGGFGKVYKAYDTHLNHYVAIKMAELRPHLEEVRLRKEVEVISKLPTHPNIAHYDVCYTFTTFAGEYDFGVLQYYEQGNLQQLLTDKQLTYFQKDSILKQILEGIVFLHNHGIIHRDLKPQNILIALNQNGLYIPKITDFGISKKLDVNKSSVFTNSLAGAGTLSFASPEQLLGSTIRKNTDLWSFGVIACWMFIGKLPFNSGALSVTSEAGRIELFKQITSGEVTSILAKLPATWSNLVRQCLIVDVEKRISEAVSCLEIVNGKTKEIFENHKSENTSVNITEISKATSESSHNKINNGSTRIEISEPKPTFTSVDVNKKKNNLGRNIFIGVAIIVLIVTSIIYFMNISDENSQQAVEIIQNDIPKIETQNDSLNYALGLVNGAEIKDSFLINVYSLEFIITSLMVGIEHGFKGEISNDKSELNQLGVRIGSSLKEQEKSGLMGQQLLKVDRKLLEQGLINGIRGLEQGMTLKEAQEYLQKTKMKFESSTNTQSNQSNKNNFTNAERILIGTKSFGSHWIYPYGTVIIKKTGGIISISGNQISGENMCSIKGEIIIIDDRNFKFNGEISLTYHDTYFETSQPIIEKKTLYGEQVFRRFGKRRYWRLKQPDSNSGYFASGYHYIDIFME